MSAGTGFFGGIFSGFGGIFGGLGLAIPAVVVIPAVAVVGFAGYQAYDNNRDDNTNRPPISR